MDIWGYIGIYRDIWDLGFRVLKECYPPRASSNPPAYIAAPHVDRIWGICGSYYNIPKALFYLLKGTIKLP